MIDEAAAAQILFGATSPSPPTQAPSNLLIEDQPAADPGARMFGGSDRPEFQQANTGENQPRTESESAQAMYGQDDPLPDFAPPDIKAERDANPLRKLYSAQVEYRDIIPDTVFDDDADAAEIPKEVRKALIVEAREMAADLGIGKGDIEIFRSVSASIKEQAPTDNQRAEWREQAVELLNAEFGNGAKQALRDAVKFANKDSRFFQLLDNSGFGDHPKIILTVARLAAKAKSKSR